MYSNCEECERSEQKTIVAFIAGLLIGGLLIWVFSSDAKVVELNGEDINTTIIEKCLDMDGIPILGNSGKLRSCDGV